jgi:exopolysaccharide biosynthesis WecB/TagA/CpsF family protein
MYKGTSSKINNKNSTKKHFDVLGIKICSTPKNRLLRQVRSAISKKKKISIVSLNNPNNIILRVPILFIQGIIIGTSIIVNKKWLTSNTVVIKGRDLFLDLVRIANKKKWRIYLVGGEGGVAEKSAQSLSRNYKKVIFKSSDGPKLNEEAVPINKEELNKEKECINDINQFNPHFIFIGFGAPKQEKWMARWIDKLDIRGAMVVGGTFDYIAAKTKLPPAYISNLGLEWLWRLLTGSQTIGRIFTATIIFPLKVFYFKMLI